MSTMMLAIRKLSAPSALLLALSFFVGAALTPAAQATQVQIEQCCDKDNAPEVPVDDGECFDCNCLECLYGIHPTVDQIDAVTPATITCSFLYSDMLLTGYIGSIDYPPEVL